jgi:hypothetical protein
MKHLHEFPARVESQDTTWLNFRVLVEPATPGPLKATLWSRDARLKAELPRVSRLEPLGNRQWLVIGQEDAWRISRVGGCGCSSSQSATSADIADWLRGIVAREPWPQEVTT